MIAQVTGTLVEITEKGVILETNGIGYLIYTPLCAAETGQTVTLHTHLVIRDDAHELYGFQHRQEKQLFVTLISVSGVGPKTALHMLSLYPMADIVRAIKSGDSKTVSLVPGIGKKTAEKVIIDLKDKLSQFETLDEDPKSDLVEALLSLGYKDTQIRTAISAIDATLPLSKQITDALRELGK